MKRKERTPLQALRLARRPPTLTELANEMGYDHSHLSRFERGLVKEPSSEFLTRYVRAMRRLGVAVTRAEVLKALEQTQPEESKPDRSGPRGRAA